MTTRWTTAAAVALVIAASLPVAPASSTLAHAGDTPTPAPAEAIAPTTYWLHGPPVAGRGRYRGPDAVVLAGEMVSTRSGCPPVRGRFTPTAAGSHVSVTWRSCPGVEGPVTLEVDLDAILGVLQGGMTIADIPGFIPQVATTTKGEAMRLGTFNVKFLPSMIFTHDPEDVDRISERIKASGYDVIALNEVFDEDARDRFVKNLKGAYPHRVEYLTGDGTFPHEDSGLMLFSRFPFEPLPQSTYQVNLPSPQFPSDAFCEGNGCGQTAFIEYQDCAGDDCESEKGAGLVRVRHPKSGHVFSVVFSHMQASYAGEPVADALDTWTEREKQFLDIEKLLKGTLTLQQLQFENIFVMGDLNVDGDPDDPDLGTSESEHNQYEWKKIFATPGSFFTDRLRDAWADDTSPDDRGLTNLVQWGTGEDAGARLDYILRSDDASDARLCTYHITRSYNLRWGDPYVESGLGEPGTEAGAANLSDHVGVTADLGPEAPFCRASEPNVVSLAPGTNLLPGSVNHVGASQWFRIDEEGTYTFEVPGDFHYHVYESTDLSTPLVPYKEKESVLEVKGQPPHIGKTFLVAKAPFYVRVFDPEHQATGPYTLWAKRHRCTEQGDACLIGPNQAIDAAFPANLYYGTENAYWFELVTEKADSGEAQELGFLVDHAGPANGLSFDVRAADGSTTLDSATGPGPHLELSRSEATAATFYFVVKRADPAPAVPFTVRWTTNLTVFHGAQVGIPDAAELRLVNFSQDDNVGDDDIHIVVDVDGFQMVGPYYVGEFDTGSQHGLEAVIGTRRFVESMKVYLIEEDDDFDGYPQPPDTNDELTFEVIDVLEPDDECQTHQVEVFQWDSAWNEAAATSGWYQLDFNLCHGVPTL